MITIREYSTDDVFFLARMLGAILGSAGEQLRTLFPEDSGKPLTEEEEEKANEETGKKVITFALNSCIVHAEPMIKEWFASLCEMSVEEFRKQSPLLVLQIIKEIVKRKDSKDFFSQAYQLYKELKSTGIDISPE